MPNIVVDGAPLPSTLLTLSHWPNNPSPGPVQRDTSTATVFAWLDGPGAEAGALPAGCVTNNHFDEDGLFGMYALGSPAAAQPHRDLLIDASFAGDFGLVRRPEAARLCFAIESLTDPATSSLDAAVFADRDRVSALYRALLPLLPDLLERLPAYRDHWSAQDEYLAASQALIAEGRVTIEEVPGLDLAIVNIPPDLAARTARRYLTDEPAAVHPFAINTATACSRLLRVQGGCLEFQYRYESWVRLASRRVPLRVDLGPFRDQLNELDGGGWVLEKASEIAPRLYRPDGRPGRLDPARFRAALMDALARGAVAWNPYDWAGPASPRSRCC